MANPTTNFGWQMPTSVDLVTDLPADFEVFGQAVDTDFVDLLGGTTGQILSKTTDTDLDFTWVNGGMSNPMTTTGDTIYSSSGSTPARLGIGSTDDVLTVVGGVPSWAAPSAGAFTKITSNTYSAQSSVTVDSVFSSSYKAYMLLIENSSGTDGASFRLQMRYGANTLTSSDYNNGGFRQKSNNTSVNYGVASESSFNLIDQSFNACGLNLYFTSVGNSSEAARFWGTGIVENTQSVALMGGRVGVNQTYTGFILLPSSGTITGRYAVYGLAN
jgi:hypothetical protein